MDNKNLTNYRKEFFDDLLLNELSNYNYKFVINYEWMKSYKEFSYSILDGALVKLSININVDNKRLVCDCDYDIDLALSLRGYFVLAYFRCIENAGCMMPQSYCQGLAYLDVINGISKGKRVLVYSCIAKKNVDCKVIDVCCMINAFTRLVAEYKNMMTSREIEECESIISKLTTFTMMPEIEYINGKMLYSYLYEIIELKKGMDNGNVDCGSYPVLGFLSRENFDEVSIEELSKKADLEENPFWRGLILRLGAHFNCEIELNNCIVDEINRFRKNSVEYAKCIKGKSDDLLNDNYHAIKMNARRIEHLSLNVEVASGVVHYYK